MNETERVDAEARLVIRHIPDVVRDVTVCLHRTSENARGSIDKSDFQTIVQEVLAAYRASTAWPHTPEPTTVDDGGDAA